MATRQVSKCEQVFYGSRWLVDIEEIKTRIAVREMGSALSNRTGDTTLRGVARRIGISHMTLHRLFTGESIGADGMKRLLHWIGAELTEVAKPIKSHAGSVISEVSDGTFITGTIKEPFNLFEIEEVQ